MTRCDECGLRYDDLEREAIPQRLRSLGLRYRAAVADADPAAMTTRPEPVVWSPLEYLCHVRDVLLVQRDRAVLALVEDRPSFARMHRDERVSLCKYDAHPVAEVLGQLAMAGELCATVFDGLEPSAWIRRLVYNWPSPAEHDLAWLARHTVHEGEHHLRDVQAVLARTSHRS